MISKAIRITHSVVNTGLLVIIVVLLLIASYALWDSKQLYAAASESNYTAYQPSPADGGRSFKELQALNPEVFAWITVYGTQIDYPVVQARTNMKYVNTNAEGNYSLSGAIFLDCDNSRDFSDFNNILYGHHMAKKTMFGEVAGFRDRDFFASHHYGNLYFDEKDHGIEFFAFLHVDAYDRKVLWPGVGEDDCLAYLDNLMAQAILAREIEVGPADHLVLLTTCSPSTTNGRDVLVGRISNEVFENPFPSAGSASRGGLISIDSLIDFFEVASQWVQPLVSFVALLLCLLILLVLQRRSRSRRRQELEQKSTDKRAQQDIPTPKLGGRP